MKIFVGSSSEQLPVIKEIVRDLKDIIEKYDIHMESWKEWFAHGQFNGWSTWRVIQEALKEFDMAIMLLATDDVVQSRNKEFKMTRDNVLLEAGAFAEKCGIENVMLLIPDDVDYKLPSDFLGLNCIVFDYARGADNSEVYKKICEKVVSFYEKELIEDKSLESNIKIKEKNENMRKVKGKLR